MKWTETKLKAFTLSFDDGITQDIRFINLINKYGLKSTFNINSGLLGRPGSIYLNGTRASHYKVHPNDVKSIYQGHEVAAHTLTHPSLPKIEDDAEVIRQIEEDRLKLSELVGYEVVGLAYPGGGVNNDDRVRKLIREHTGIKYARTIKSIDSFDVQEDLLELNPNVNSIFQGNRIMELGEKFISLQPDKPQIFYVWGHSYDLDFREDFWPRLEEFFKLISGKEDIFYGTNREVFLGE